MKEPDVGLALAAVPLFCNVPPRVLDDLVRDSRGRTYPKGQILCHEGDPGDDLIVLESGQLRVSRYTVLGTEAVLAVYDAPAVLGELALLDGAPRDATITAQQEVQVRLVPRAAFLRLLEQEPAMVRGLLQSLASMVRASNARHADVIGLDVPGRLAKWLLGQASSTDGGVEAGSIIPIRGSQSDLAAELGTTRSTLNRALHDFASLGMIQVDGSIVTILEPRMLASYT